MEQLEAELNAAVAEDDTSFDAATTLYPALIEHAAAELLSTDACDLEAELTKIMDSETADIATQVEQAVINRAVSETDAVVINRVVAEADAADAAEARLAEIIIGNTEVTEPAREATCHLWLQAVRLC